MSFDFGFTVNDIKQYLLINGGKVGYHELVKHFKHYLSQPNTQNEARNAFKDYVNRLATVSIENNQKYLVLRPEFIDEYNRSKSIAVPEMKSDAINTIGLPIAEKRRSHSMNDEKDLNEPKVQIRAQFNSKDSKPGLSSQYSFCQQYSDVPPQPPPRRRSSTGGSKAKLEERLKQFDEEKNDKENQSLSPPHQQQEKLKEIHELSTQTPGRVKEHAQKIDKMASLTELKPPMPSNASNIPSTRPKARSLIKDEDTDSGSVQPLDPLRKKWIISSSNCDYNKLVSLLKEEPKLSGYKDFTSGYTALHWAAKFNKPEIIKLIAGTHGINPNVKSFGGYTPLHLAALHTNEYIMELLIRTYNADPNIRDNSGKKPAQYLVSKVKTNTSSTGNKSNGIIRNQPLIFGPSHNHKPIQARTSTESSSSFIRIGSLKAASKMKKITGIGLKSWGSVESISEKNSKPVQNSLKKSKKNKKSMKFSTSEKPQLKDSDSDSAYGFQ